MCSLAAHPSPAPLAVPATPTPLPTTLPHLPGDTGFPGRQRPSLLCELSQDPTGRTRPRCLACRQYLWGKRPISLKSPGLTVNLTLFLKAVKTSATGGDVTLTAKMLAAHTSPQPFQDATCQTSGDVWGLAETLSGSREGAGLRRSRVWLSSRPGAPHTPWGGPWDPGLPRPLSPAADTQRATALRLLSRPRVSCARHLSAFLPWSLSSRGLCPPQSHLRFGAGAGSSQLLPGPRSAPHLSLLPPPVSALRTFPPT